MMDLTNDGLGKAVFPHILAVPVEAQNDFSIDDDDGNRRSFDCLLYTSPSPRDS